MNRRKRHRPRSAGREKKMADKLIAEIKIDSDELASKIVNLIDSMYWISVKDRLPQDGLTLTVALSEEDGLYDTTIAFYEEERTGEKWEDAKTYKPISNVIAWFPIPPYLKEVDKDE